MPAVKCFFAAVKYSELPAVKCSVGCGEVLFQCGEVRVMPAVKWFVAAVKYSELPVVKCSVGWGSVLRSACGEVMRAACGDVLCCLRRSALLPALKCPECADWNRSELRAPQGSEVKCYE